MRALGIAIATIFSPHINQIRVSGSLRKLSVSSSIPPICEVITFHQPLTPPSHPAENSTPTKQPSPPSTQQKLPIFTRSNHSSPSPYHQLQIRNTTSPHRGTSAAPRATASRFPIGSTACALRMRQIRSPIQPSALAIACVNLVDV
jgi:hypothetical protein